MAEQLPRVKYLTNKDILEELHKSKKTYSSYLADEYTDYDFIADDLESITPEKLEEERVAKYNAMFSKLKKEMTAKGIKNPVISLRLEDVPTESVVVRIMTYKHIPLNADPEKVAKAKKIYDMHVKVNFPPFQHFIFKDDSWVCVGKSHWKNGLQNGHFSMSHGRMTNKLAMMFMKLVEKYGHRSNWRGYCIDSETEALTDRGWLGINEITEYDKIVSYSDGDLKWSKIKSIYRGEFDGLMHKMTTRGMDALVTPGHKMVTERGLIKAEYLLKTDRMILMGDKLNDNVEEIYSDDMVELLGWVLTEGCYDTRPDGIKSVTIYQNEGPKADRIRNCLNNLGYTFSEGKREKNIGFRVCKTDTKKIHEIIPEKNLTMSLIFSLSQKQRELLMQTMIDGDGWRTGDNKQYLHYTQKNKEHIDMFQTLCCLNGRRSTINYVESVSFGKPTGVYTMNIFSKKGNIAKAGTIDFHGGMKSNKGHYGKTKEHYQNEPTTYYKGMVWCPETEYGCFVARRNGTVYLTGNTYLDEMKSQALVQLSRMGLKFDESRSINPFGYFTTIISNSFLGVLNLEKKNQNIRDDLLIMHGASPSHTRAVEDSIAQQQDFANDAAAKNK